MGGNIGYIPTAFCVKCRKAPNLVTRERKSGQRPKLIAHCHGEKEEFDFVYEPGKTVDVFVEQVK